MSRRYTAAVIPGSFDPITVGHLDVIRFAAALFDTVYVTVFHNAEKHGMFTEEEKLHMVKLATANFSNVICSVEHGVLSDFAAEHHAVIVKGVRGTTDFDYENNLASINRKINQDTETILYPAQLEHAYISSTYVREMIRYNKDFSNAVPTAVYQYLKEEWRKQ